MNIDDYRSLLTEPVTGGLYALPNTAGIEAHLTAAGWTVRKVYDFEDREGFYLQFAYGLGFPKYSGHNLDALWDSLGDVPARTAVIIDWLPFALEEPDYSARVRSVLAERAATDPLFAVILDTGAVNDPDRPD